MSSPGPALSQGYGYGIILGVGFAFAVFMVRCMPGTPR